jgi:uncharacterized phage protein (TIGR02218 family)
MTTFDALESSVESSRPIELYQFTLGTDFFRYTSAEDTITVGINDFVPESIARDTIAQGSDQENRTLSITLPSSNAFAAQYIDIVPGERASLDVFRFQRNEVPSLSTQILLFKGIVQSVRFPNDGSSAEVAVRSIETALNRVVPRYTYMAMCNHFLYDAQCQVDPDLFNIIGEVTAVAGRVITVTGASGSGFDFTGGYCRPTGENDFRVILEHSGDDLTLLLPFRTDVLGGDVQVFAGCDHLVKGDCALVFDNVINFGGDPFVPNRNIFRDGLPIA